jgi:hypothetical protein
VKPDSTTLYVNRVPAQIDQEISLWASGQLEFFLKDASCLFQFDGIVEIQVWKDLDILSQTWCGEGEQKKNGAEVHG